MSERQCSKGNQRPTGHRGVHIFPGFSGLCPRHLLFSLYTAPWVFSFTPIKAAVATNILTIPNVDLSAGSRPIYPWASLHVWLAGPSTQWAQHRSILITKLASSWDPLIQQMQPQVTQPIIPGLGKHRVILNAFYQPSHMPVCLWHCSLYHPHPHLANSLSDRLLYVSFSLGKELLICI